MNGIECQLARLDAADDVCLLRLTFDWIDATVVMFMSRVLLRQFIQMAQLSRFADVHRALHFDPASGIVRIDDEQAHFGIGLHVPALLLFTCRVDA